MRESGDDVLMVRADAGFAPRPNVVAVVRGRVAPPAGQVPVTSASAVVRDSGGAVLLTYVPGRGYDLPGGHVDAGETPLAACVREVAEETGLVLAEDGVAGLAAAIVVEVAAPRPAGFPYPYPRSQMWVYRFDVAVHRPPLAPSPDFECTRARWVSDEHLRLLCGTRIWLPAISLPPPSPDDGREV